MKKIPYPFMAIGSLLMLVAGAVVIGGLVRANGTPRGSIAQSEQWGSISKRVAAFHGANSIPADEITDAAAKALLLELQIPCYWRIMEDKDDGSNLSVIPEHVFDHVPEATPAKIMLNHLAHPPSDSVKVNFNTAMRDAWTNKGEQLLNKMFVPNSPAFQRLSNLLHQTAAKAEGTNIAMDAGLNWMRWSDERVYGTKAFLSGTGDAWSTFAQWQAGGYAPAAPHNQMNYTVTLHKIDGQWKVSNIQWTFAPGSEP